MYKKILNEQNQNTVASEFNGGLTYPQTVHELVQRVNEIDDGRVDIKDGSVTSIKLADNAVVNTKIENGAVTQNKLSTNSVGTSNIQNSSVSNEKISDVDISKIDCDNIAVGKVLSVSSTPQGNTITGVDLNNVPPTMGVPTGNILGITSPNTYGWVPNTSIPTIADNSITTRMLASGAVDQYKLGDGAVTTSKIATSSITSNKLANGAVTNASILDKSISLEKLESLPTADIPDHSITNSKMSDNAIGTSNIINGAVTSSKVAENSIGAINVIDKSIGVSKINGIGGTAGQILSTDGTNVTWSDPSGGGLPPEDSITTAMLQNQSVTSDKIATDSITANKIPNNSVSLGKLIGSAIAGQVATSDLDMNVTWQTPSVPTPSPKSITTEMIADYSIGEPQLKNQSVSSAKILSNAVTHNKIAEQSVYASNMYLSNIEKSSAKIAEIVQTEVSTSWTKNETNGLWEYTFTTFAGSLTVYLGKAHLLPNYIIYVDFSNGVMSPSCFLGIDNKLYEAVSGIKNGFSSFGITVRSDRETPPTKITLTSIFPTQF
ncbi:MAG: hypothetical protein PHX08_08855 [Lachnospiraceae bacterium]|nr:hypothetical protein [Lachnospiraceae bacterium]